MRIAALLIALLTLSCGSTHSANVLMPQLHMEQLTGVSQSAFMRGPLSIRYKLFVYNRSSEEITLRQLELRTVSPGAYVPSSSPLPFNQRVAPNTTAMITFSVRAFAAGGQGISNQPVTVRAVAYFESPEGPFYQTFVENFDQFEVNARD